MEDIKDELNAAVLHAKKHCIELRKKQPISNDVHVKRYLYAVAVARNQFSASKHHPTSRRSRSLTRVYVEEKQERSNSVTPSLSNVGPEKTDYFENEINDDQVRLEWHETVEGGEEDVQADDEAAVEHLQKTLPRDHVEWSHDHSVKEKEDSVNGKTVTLRVGDHLYGFDTARDLSLQLPAKIHHFFTGEELLSARSFYSSMPNLDISTLSQPIVSSTIRKESVGSVSNLSGAGYGYGFRQHDSSRDFIRPLGERNLELHPTLQDHRVREDLFSRDSAQYEASPFRHVASPSSEFAKYQNLHRRGDSSSSQSELYVRYHHTPIRSPYGTLSQDFTASTPSLYTPLESEQNSSTTRTMLSQLSHEANAATRHDDAAVNKTEQHSTTLEHVHSAPANIPIESTVSSVDTSILATSPQHHYEAVSVRNSVVHPVSVEKSFSRTASVYEHIPIRSPNPDVLGERSQSLMSLDSVGPSVSPYNHIPLYTPVTVEECQQLSRDQRSSTNTSVETVVHVSNSTGHHDSGLERSISTSSSLFEHIPIMSTNRTVMAERSQSLQSLNSVRPVHSFPDHFLHRTPVATIQEHQHESSQEEVHQEAHTTDHVERKVSTTSSIYEHIPISSRNRHVLADRSQSMHSLNSIRPTSSFHESIAIRRPASTHEASGKRSSESANNSSMYSSSIKTARYEHIPLPSMHKSVAHSVETSGLCETRNNTVETDFTRVERAVSTSSSIYEHIPIMSRTREVTAQRSHSYATLPYELTTPRVHSPHHVSTTREEHHHVERGATAETSVKRSYSQENLTSPITRYEHIPIASSPIEVVRPHTLTEKKISSVSIEHHGNVSSKHSLTDHIPIMSSTRQVQQQQVHTVHDSQPCCSGTMTGTISIDDSQMNNTTNEKAYSVETSVHYPEHEQTRASSVASNHTIGMFDHIPIASPNRQVARDAIFTESVVPGPRKILDVESFPEIEPLNLFVTKEKNLLTDPIPIIRELHIEDEVSLEEYENRMRTESYVSESPNHQIDSHELVLECNLISDADISATDINSQLFEESVLNVVGMKSETQSQPLEVKRVEDVGSSTNLASHAEITVSSLELQKGTSTEHMETVVTQESTQEEHQVETTENSVESVSLEYAGNVDSEAEHMETVVIQESTQEEHLVKMMENSAEYVPHVEKTNNDSDDHHEEELAVQIENETTSSVDVGTSDETSEHIEQTETEVKNTVTQQSSDEAEVVGDNNSSETAEPATDSQDEEIGSVEHATEAHEEIEVNEEIESNEIHTEAETHDVVEETQETAEQQEEHHEVHSEEVVLEQQEATEDVVDNHSDGEEHESVPEETTENVTTTASLVLETAAEHTEVVLTKPAENSEEEHLEVEAVQLEPDTETVDNLSEDEQKTTEDWVEISEAEIVEAAAEAITLEEHQSDEVQETEHAQLSEDSSINEKTTTESVDVVEHDENLQSTPDDTSETDEAVVSNSSLEAVATSVGEDAECAKNILEGHEETGTGEVHTSHTEMTEEQENGIHHASMIQVGQETRLSKSHSDLYSAQPVSQEGDYAEIYHASSTSVIDGFAEKFTADLAHVEEILKESKEYLDKSKAKEEPIYSAVHEERIYDKVAGDHAETKNGTPPSTPANGLTNPPFQAKGAISNEELHYAATGIRKGEEHLYKDDENIYEEIDDRHIEKQEDHIYETPLGATQQHADVENSGIQKEEIVSSSQSIAELRQQFEKGSSEESVHKRPVPKRRDFGAQESKEDISADVNANVEEDKTVHREKSQDGVQIGHTLIEGELEAAHRAHETLASYERSSTQEFEQLEKESAYKIHRDVKPYSGSPSFNKLQREFFPEEIQSRTLEDVSVLSSPTTVITNNGQVELEDRAYDKNVYEDVVVKPRLDEDGERELARTTHAIRRMSRNNQWSEEENTAMISRQRSVNLEDVIPPNSPFVDKSKIPRRIVSVEAKIEKSIPAPLDLTYTETSQRNVDGRGLKHVEVEPATPATPITPEIQYYKGFVNDAKKKFENPEDSSVHKTSQQIKLHRARSPVKHRRPAETVQKAVADEIAVEHHAEEAKKETALPLQSSSEDHVEHRVSRADARREEYSERRKSVSEMTKSYEEMLVTRSRSSSRANSPEPKRDVPSLDKVDKQMSDLTTSVSSSAIPPEQSSTAKRTIHRTLRSFVDQPVESVEHVASPVQQAVEELDKETGHIVTPTEQEAARISTTLRRSTTQDVREAVAEMDREREGAAAHVHHPSGGSISPTWIVRRSPSPIENRAAVASFVPENRAAAAVPAATRSPAPSPLQPRAAVRTSHYEPLPIIEKVRVVESSENRAPSVEQAENRAPSAVESHETEQLEVQTLQRNGSGRRSWTVKTYENNIRFSNQKLKMPDIEFATSNGDVSNGLEKLGGEESQVLKDWDPRKLVHALYEVSYEPRVETKRNRFVNMEGHVDVPSDETNTLAELEREWKQQYMRTKEGRLQIFVTHCAEESPAQEIILSGTDVDANREERTLTIHGGKEHVKLIIRVPSAVFDKWRQAILSHAASSQIDAYVKPIPKALPHLKERVVVIELGSSSIRGGVLMSETTLPQSFFPAIAVRTSEGKVVVGEEAYAPQTRHSGDFVRPIQAADPALERYTIDREVVRECMAKVVRDVQVNPTKYKVLLSVPQNLPNVLIGELLTIALQDIKFQGAAITRQPSLILYSYDVTTGVVVDIGDTLNIVPVIDGYVVDSAICSIPYGATQVREALRTQLSANNRGLYSYQSPIEKLILRYVMEHTCYVPEDYGKEEKTSHPDIDISLDEFNPTHAMPTHFKIDSSRFSCTEGLFRPKKWGMDTKGIHQLIHEAVQMSPIDSRRLLYRNIFLAGGASLLPGLAEKLESELANIVPSTIHTQVHISPWRYNAAYLGAQIVASSSTFEDGCVSAENLHKYLHDLSSSTI